MDHRRGLSHGTGERKEVVGTQQVNMLRDSRKLLKKDENSLNFRFRRELEIVWHKIGRKGKTGGE